MSGPYSLAQAGRWFLESGIQEANGGVARYYQSDLHRNKPISTEITGYTASALVFLYRLTGEALYLDRAVQAVHFLANDVWDSGLETFPYEYPSPSPVSEHRAYFFDCGIIIRALLAVWEITKEQKLLDLASRASHAMIRDFHSGEDYHPILLLPDLEPYERIDHWSRMSGCYQAKSALAWWETAQITGEHKLRQAYLDFMGHSLGTYHSFLPGTSERIRIMDRLHAYSYFLESLYPLLDRTECVAAYRFALDAAGTYLREIAPEFARADVYAQVLRARVTAANVIPPNAALAAGEFAALATYQAHDADLRIDGGFWFGRRSGVLSPQVNPVSTAFAIQALEAWRGWNAGESDPCRMPPI